MLTFLPARLHSPDRRLLVSLLAEDQENRCCYCQRSFIAGKIDPTLEHLHGIKNRTPFLRTSVAAACEDCNHAKGMLSHEIKHFGGIRSRTLKKITKRYSQRVRKAIGLWTPNTSASTLKEIN